MSITAPLGWKAAGVRAGTKPSGDLDLAVFVSDQPASVAAAFTSNQVVGAPITVCKPRVAAGTARGVVITAGIANVATGQQGLDAAEEMISIASKELGFSSDEMLCSATGVIGHHLPMDIIAPGIASACAELSVEGGEAAARAILTTDARPKTVSRSIEVGGKTVTLGAMAKGAGMIAPRLELHATMLVFITTDGQASAADLRKLLRRNLDRTLNSISVDACTSTSDTVMLFANGASGVPVGDSKEFEQALIEILSDLAYMIVQDGEGATKVVRVRVSGAQNDDQAMACAREVATSLLVRCAVAGGDPNWGRIAQAIGQTPGLSLQTEKLQVSVCKVPVADAGALTGREKEAAAAMKQPGDTLIEIDLGIGNGNWEFLSSDLTPEYVTFNAEYTT
jgi:glutamate N-acetyltransferase / amino-acid N-acetyltransferase